MQLPLQITFHGVDHSDAVEQRIRDKVAKLEQLFDRITSCRVAVESNHRNTSNLHHKGDGIQVTAVVTVPGTELVVKRDSEEHEDIYGTLKGVFGAMERQVKDYVSRQRGDIKTRAQD